jgi:type II secretory pathway pseudopilin PulG
MTLKMPVHHNNRGFTLVETIIYIGLFALMFTGIFTSMYPIFTNAEKLTKNILTEGETAFILSKLHYALAQGISDPTRFITSPSQGNEGNELVINDGGVELFRFEEDLSNTFCTPPRVCGFITYSEDSDDPLPLNAERVFIEDFLVKHVAPNGDMPRYVEISFTANTVPIGPIVYYLHF